MSPGKWKQFKSLFAARFKMTFREKSVWFWSIFYPVLLLVVFIMIFGNISNGSFSAKLAIVEQDRNAAAAGLYEALKHVDVFEYRSEEPVKKEQAEQWLLDKKIDGIVVLPSENEASQLDLILHKEKQNSSTAQIMESILNQVLQQTGNKGAAEAGGIRLQTDYIAAGSDKLSYIDFLLTGLIALSISQAGLFGMVSMVEMRRNGLLKRLVMTPASMGLFGLGDISVRFILSAIQIVLLTLLGVLAFDAHLNINVISFLIAFVVGTLSFTGMGFMVAAFSKSMEAYFGIANLFSFLMMFMSGIFFDIQALPSYLKPLSDIMPLTYFANGIRDGMVYGASAWSGSYWLNIAVMAVWGLAAVAIGSRFYNWKESR
ncbi:ABC transporter permease [Paenibacillus sp. GCM10027626]|uniref:ABC transporter permease n=1 Tax=Paenibacillus sp. GCM10027626 TaxID=3273411 RepID=UPI00363EB060